MTTATDVKTEKLFVDSLFAKSVREGKVDKLTALNIEKLTGDASSRSYFRIRGEEGSYVACLDQSLTGLKKLEEVDFLSAQNVLHKEGVTVPEIFHVDFKKGYVLQEDLGDITFLRTLSLIENKEEEFKHYKCAIDELLKIQSVPLEQMRDTVFKNRSFDEEKLMFEVDFTIKHLIDGLFDLSLDSDRKIKIRNNFEKLVKELASQSRVLTHRDYHSRNIMVKQGKLKVIDFQDMRMGIPQYDLVSLLEDCYYNVDSENKDKLKKYYWSEAQKLGVLVEGTNYSWDDFLVFYNKMAVQRTFKALGSFAYIYHYRDDIRYLKYIGYSFEQLKGFMFTDSAYKELRTLLSEVYYEY